MVLSLATFSTELLLKIFNYLDIPDLCRLKRTCKRFNEIIEQWGHSLNQNVRPVVTNQMDPLLVNRSMRLLSSIDRLRISRNWKLGTYTEKVFLYTKRRYMPWLQLEKDLLWVAKGRYLQAYRRTRKGINPRSVYSIQAKYHSDEFGRFVKKGNLVLSGPSGTLCLWSQETQNFIFQLEDYHGSDINSVDMCDNIVVSGSTDSYVKIRSLEPSTEISKINMHDKVYSVALSEQNKSLLAVGTARLSTLKALSIYDINRQKLFFRPKIDGGVLDIKWESSSVLWSCGYGGLVMKWDLRTGKCEKSYADPNYSHLYCFQFDGFNTIIGGTACQGRAVVWDTRQNNYVQMYFMDSCRQGKSSPVYSLSYDPEFLFVATDRCINVLDFSRFSGTSKNYANLFYKTIRA